ncbi:MAG: hypothetical protein JNN04_09445 [Cyclobacteriaceae bacterium]|nr:hypothetical protein [Cyclobacteriaceae bacterium]
MNARNVLIGLAAGCGLLAVLWFAYDKSTAVDFAALNAAEWKPVQAGIPFVQFDAPFELKDESRPPLGDERQFLKRNQRFTYQAGNDLQVIATIVDYLPHVYIDPNALELSIRGFDKQFGASNLTFQINDVVMSTYKAKLAEGTFLIGTKKYIFTRVNVEYRNNYRDLLIIVKDGDPEAERLRKRIVGTIQFQLL